MPALVILIALGVRIALSLRERMRLRFKPQVPNAARWSDGAIEP